jgi:hypothetical protein
LCVCAAGVGRHNGCNHLNIHGEEEEGGELYRSYGFPPSLIPLIEMLMSIGWASWGDPFFLPLYVVVGGGQKSVTDVLCTTHVKVRRTRIQ